MDFFSKQLHFIPCQNIFMAKQLTKISLDHIYRLHGVPQQIISDGGVQLTSKFWRVFLDLLGTEQGLHSSHHPQSNSGTK